MAPPGGERILRATMRLVLLSPNPPDCVAFGPRQLSAVLRAAGNECSIVFLRGGVGQHADDGSRAYRYPDSLVQDVLQICRGADAVGVSFISLYWDRAVQLTRAVQEHLGLPVIWGGTHATVRPRTSIRIADYVAVGDGEDALVRWLEALGGGDPAAIPGIWSRRGDQVVEQGWAPDYMDVQSSPWPDWDTRGHWVDQGERLVPMTTERMREVLPRLPGPGGTQRIAVRVMATRGCPHRCTYCASSAQRAMRRRSPEATVQHMAWLKRRYPFLEAIYEFDDTFMATPMGWLRQFATLYREQVGLPLYCQTSPTTLSRAKLDLLVGAGLVYLEMGVQSGSDEIKQLFQRSESEEQVREAAAMLSEYHAAGKLLRPRYHVIVDVPWEPVQSVLSTVDLLLSLPRPFDLAIGSLVLFPGTELNRRAWAEGLLWDEVSQVYRKPFLRPTPSLVNFLIRASALEAVPRPLLHALARPSTLEPTAFSRALHRWADALEWGQRAGEAVGRGDVERLLRVLGRVR